jgi:hypothetical protein
LQRRIPTGGVEENQRIEQEIVAARVDALG